MIILLEGAATPEDEPFTFEGETEIGLGLVVEEAALGEDGKGAILPSAVKDHCMRTGPGAAVHVAMRL
ncbi:hypothetical protein D3C87_2104780 [compost metagenome]